jgi:hypothetical protein
VRRVPLAGLLILAALLLSATAFAAVEQSGTLRVAVSTRISPYRLPRTGAAPITAHIAGHVFSTTGGVPPQLTDLDILVNRHGHFATSGIPACTLSELQPGTNERALRECGPSLVGSGHFWASVVFSENRPYNTTGRLMIFAGMGCSSEPAQSRPNPVGAILRKISSSLFSGRDRPSRSRTQEGRQGERALARDPQAAARGRRDAKCRPRPEIFAHIYTTQPFPTSFVVTFAVSKISKGPWGTELQGSLPSALGDWGFVDRIKLNLGRTFKLAGGTEVGYVEAGCPAPAGTDTAVFPLARANLGFADGESLSTTISKPCGVAKE